MDFSDPLSEQKEVSLLYIVHANKQACGYITSYEESLDLSENPVSQSKYLQMGSAALSSLQHHAVI